MINKYSNVPLYSQLKHLIIKKIESGEYKGESRIPSEQELCELYDISRPTVRQAISELTNNGYLYKEKGKGTFVAKSKSKVDIKDYTGFTDSILDNQDPSQHDILSLHVVKLSDADFLESVFGSQSYSGNSEFAEISYLTAEEGGVLSYNVSFVPLALFPDLIEDLKARRPSYEILRGKYPLLPVRTKSSLEIVYTDQADAQYLQVQTGFPVIKIHNTLYSKSGQPVEHIIAKYRADKCQLVFEHSK
ncbi:MAG: GntR family transcriptional regulator [Clostridiaceae bacterium]|nr:GntR family transcriptional regulator [Clostridiaceae bacterium]